MSYIDFRGKCPAKGCPNQTRYMLWVHAGCGATMQIGNNAYLRCTRGHSYHIRYWKFKCDQHDYRESAPEHFGDAISIAIQQMGTAGVQWSQTLMGNMGSW